LGQLLVDARLVTAEALEEVLASQKSDGRRLGTLLVERGLVNETQLTQILSHQLAVPWVSLLHIEFSRQLLNLVPRETAEQYCLVPIYVRHVRGQGETLYVAMEDPSNEEGLRACGAFSGLPVRAMIAPPSDIRSAIRVYYGGSQRAAQGEASAPPAASPAVEPVKSTPEPVKTASEPAKSAAHPRADDDAPVIEAVEIAVSARAAERLQRLGEEPSPPSEREVATIPQPKGHARRMVALTLLDGTTISLPPRGAGAPAGEDEPDAPREPAQELTARDLVAALRAVADGADASEVLGEAPRWEPMFAALLSVLLKKHLIADWEFVEEYTAAVRAGAAAKPRA
jgi:type IV pilus assembly protein PilB